MMLLKACPHCGGDLGVDFDRSCGYLECVQCGHILSRSQELALGVRVTRHGIVQRGAPAGEPAQWHAPDPPALATQLKW